MVKVSDSNKNPWVISQDSSFGAVSWPISVRNAGMIIVSQVAVLYYCCSVSKTCLTLYDPMHCSMQGFPVFHYLPVVAPSHAHWVSDTIQPSHLVLTSSPLALNLSQHQDLFQYSQLFASGDQNIRASASASVLPMNIQGWFPLGLTEFNLLALQGTLKNLSPTPQFESISSLVLSHLYGPALISVYDYYKNIALTIWIFVDKVMSLFLNTLSRLVITFLPRSKHLLISRL